MNDHGRNVQPLAVFSVKSLLWRQTYQLFSDRIMVDAQYLFSGYSSGTYLLKDLTIFPSRGSSRGENLYMSVLLMFVGVGVIAWMYYVDGFETHKVPTIMVVMAITGAIWFLSSLRLWHFAHFSSPAGVNVLCLWSTPGNREAFDVFVRTCVDRIEALQENRNEDEIKA